MNENVQTEYTRLLAAIRARKTACADCARPIQESVTGVKARKARNSTELICDACFYSELGDRLPSDMPHVASFNAAI